MHYLQLTAATVLPDISALRPFKAIVVAEEILAEGRQAAISQWLVESGCLYMMAWGEACGSWEEFVAAANLQPFIDFEGIPDASLVMATCHADESLQELFWYSKHSAMHPCHELGNVVLVHLSALGREQELTEEYMRA